MRGLFFGVLAGLAVGASPATVRADGMSFPDLESAQMEVRATEQRAILWQRDGTWETHIQPRFSREPGAAAWVVPFPVRPQVHQSSAELFDQIELLTSPVFLEYCWPEDETVGCGGEMRAGDDGSGATAVGEGDTSVVVWEHGEVGELDYVILSATDGDSLVDWLDDEGFAVPAEAEDLLAGLETEGTFYFAARLAASVDPARPLAPVRFVLPGLPEPSYPLQLTGLGISGDDLLDLTLWVVFPRGVQLVPDSHPYQAFGQQPQSLAQYRAAVDIFFDGHSRDTFLILSSVDGWMLGEAMSRGALCDEEGYMEGWGSFCFPFEDPPESWAPELVELGAEGWSEDEEGYTVFRLQGRLDAEALSRDLTLETLDGWVTVPGNVYTISTGTCEEVGDFSSCSLFGRRTGTPAAVLLPILVALALVVRRARAARRRCSGPGARGRR